MRAGLLALAAMLSLSVAQSASALRVGYNDDPARFLAVPRAVEHSNTQIARVNFAWPQIEPANGEFDWSAVDRLMELFRSAQITPIINIFGSPAWAAPDRPGIQCPCDRLADPYWMRMWQRLAQRYPDAILNVWNEPNLINFGSVDVDRMAQLVNEAAQAVWQVAPGRTVLGPPIAPVGDWVSYARALYPQLDPRIALSANLYPYARVGAHKSFRQLIESLRGDLASVQRIARGRQIWITETNVSRYDVSPRRQTRYIRAAYAIARQKRVAGMIVYRLWSAWTPGDGIFGWDAGLSALEHSGAPTSLYNQVGRLHPGFRRLQVRAGSSDGGGIVTGTPPVPVLTPPGSIQPCPDSR